MTKSQLIKALEPFNDEIEIIVPTVDRIRLFYWLKYGEAKIILGDDRPEGKTVELRID